MLLTRQRRFSRAKDLLDKSQAIKQDVGDDLGVPEILLWQGYWHETKGDWENAVNTYQDSLDWNWIGRRHCEASAMVGVSRVLYQQGLLREVPSYYAKAEQIAQKYQYNDLLAELQMLQGQIKLTESFKLESQNSLDVVKGHFEKALVYGMRHNRFFLDDVLNNLIEICLAMNQQGKDLLSSLRNFWNMGKDAEGTPFLTSEESARSQEPGDRTRQTSVLQQLDQALNSWQ